MLNKRAQRTGAMLAALLVAGPAAPAQAPVAPILQPQLPRECRERDADPEKCVINDGPPSGQIVRKKPAPPPVSPKPSPVVLPEPPRLAPAK